MRKHVAAPRTATQRRRARADCARSTGRGAPRRTCVAAGLGSHRYGVQPPSSVRGRPSSQLSARLRAVRALLGARGSRLERQARARARREPFLLPSCEHRPKVYNGRSTPTADAWSPKRTAPRTCTAHRANRCTAAGAARDGAPRKHAERGCAPRTPHQHLQSRDFQDATATRRCNTPCSSHHTGSRGGCFRMLGPKPRRRARDLSASLLAPYVASTPGHRCACNFVCARPLGNCAAARSARGTRSASGGAGPGGAFLAGPFSGFRLLTSRMTWRGPAGHHTRA